MVPRKRGAIVNGKDYLFNVFFIVVALYFLLLGYVVTPRKKNAEDRKKEIKLSRTIGWILLITNTVILLTKLL